MEEIGGVWSSCADRELPAYYHWRRLFPLRWMILISNNCIPPSCIISAYVIVIPINHSSHLYILRIPAAEWYLPFKFVLDWNAVTLWEITLIMPQVNTLIRFTLVYTLRDLSHTLFDMFRGFKIHRHWDGHTPDSCSGKVWVSSNWRLTATKAMLAHTASE